MLFNFEKKTEPLAPLSKFTRRMISHACFGIFLIVIMTLVGMIGLGYLEKMTIVDSFANASMIMSGVGAITPIVTNAGKCFSGCYSIIAGLVFMIVIGIVFSPVLHRIFHKFHLSE
jgi:uncharacterized membrane protein